jgi:hypothetical protein
MSFKFIAKISHKELDKRCDPELYGNRAQPGMERWIRANAVTRGPVWTPLIPPTMPSDKVDHFGEQVRSAHLSRIRLAPGLCDVSTTREGWLQRARSTPKMNPVDGHPRFALLGIVIVCSSGIFNAAREPRLLANVSKR